MRRYRVALAAAAVAVGFGLAAVVWMTRSGEGESTIEETVHQFFEARQTGDCARLRSLSSQASWSEDGRLNREDFDEHCERIVESYQPELHDAHIRSETDDRATVRIEIRRDIDDSPVPEPGPTPREEGLVVYEPDVTDPETDEPVRLAYENGHLVREDGEWKVALDNRAFGLGRSPEETVWGYLEAYRDGDCDQLIDHLSENAWSTNGEMTRDEFFDDCHAAAEARPLPPMDDDLREPFAVVPALDMPLTIAVSLGADDRRATFHWPLSPTRQESVPLVVEDLEWRVDDGTLDAMGYIELGTRLVDEALGFELSTAGWVAMVYPDPQGSGSFIEFDGDDAVRHREAAGFERGLALDLEGHPRGVQLLLYEFADAEGASSYAEHLTDRLVARASEYQDVAPVEVPAADDGTAIVTECSGPAFRPRSVGGDCDQANRAAAVASQDRFLVAVEATDYEGDSDPTAEEMLAQPMEVMEEQLELLEGA